MNYIYIINRSTIILSLLLFVIFLIGLSLQQIFTWQFAEFYAGMERLLHNKELYPHKTELNDNLVSSYFPGLTFFLLLIKKMFFFIKINYISNYLLSIPFIIILLYQQFLLAKKDNDSIDLYSFMIISIFLYMTIFRHHTEYAASFKPDTIALVICLFSIMLNMKFNNNLIHLIAGIVFACAIVFKQQILIFFISYLFFISIINFYKNRYFIISSILSLIIIFYCLLRINHFYEYTILSFTDDNFMSLSKWVDLHTGLFLWILIFLPILFFNIDFKQRLLSFYFFLKNKLINFDALFFSLFIFGIVNFVSSFKYGGNSGNTAFAIICIYPYLFNILEVKLNKLLSIFIIVFITFTSLSSIKAGSTEYSNFLNLDKKISKKNEDISAFQNMLYPVSFKAKERLYFSVNVNPIELISQIYDDKASLDRNVYIIVSPKMYKKWQENYKSYLNQTLIVQYKNQSGIILIIKDD